MRDMLQAMTVGPTLDELVLADEPARWSTLGFAVADDCCQLGRVRIRLAGADGGPASGTGVGVGAATGRGIVRWSLRGIANDELDGLPTVRSHAPLPAPAPAHPNGALAIDHVVAMSPDLDRTVTALQGAGLDLRRIREQPTLAGAPRQAFFRLGAEILEVVQVPAAVIEREGGSEQPARLWGLALTVLDLDRTVAALGAHVGSIRPAVQSGRRIATLHRSAGLALPVALMSRTEET